MPLPRPYPSSSDVIVPTLVEFLLPLLKNGEVVLSERPVVRAREHAEAARCLEAVYADYRLDVAGPLLPFHRESAIQAAECLRSACWFLVDRTAEPTEAGAAAALPAPAGNAAQHLSVDLIFRFLPPVYYRARAISPDDVLTRALAKLLRQWPLSGVLADVAEKPLTPLDFGAHAGLQMLYAERLADRPRPEWMPEGPPLEYVNLVLSERGQCP